MTAKPFQLGPWLVRPDSSRIYGEAGEVILEPKTMELLVYLAERQGEVVSADAFINTIWGGRALGDNPVYKTIAKLRRALGDNSETPAFIETIPKKGYRLICSVSEATAVSSVSGGEAGGSPEVKPESWLRAVKPKHLVLIFLTAVIVMFGVGAFILRQSPETAPQFERISVAVLPFANFGATDEDALFADGVAEEILNKLAQSPDLKVVARTSSFRFRDEARDIGEIGAALNAQYLIEGSVRRSDDELRVTAQLIESSSGYHLWSDTFDREQRNIFAIQNDIAIAVASALDVRLLQSGQTNTPTSDLEAWEMYLHGKALWQRKGEGPIRAAIQLFENAIQRDPEFAEAWAALSEAWIVLPQYAQEDPALFVARGEEAAKQAITLNPTLAQPYLSLAAYENRQGNYVAGIKYAEDAFDKAPHHTGVLNTMSYNYGRAGWIKDALAYSKDGVELDPLEGGEYITLGYLQMVDGDLDAARATFLRGWNDLGLKAYFLWAGLFEIHLLKGQYDEAEDWLRFNPGQKNVMLQSLLIDSLRGSDEIKREQAIAQMIATADAGETPLHEIFVYLLMLGAEDEAYNIVKNGIAKKSFFMIHYLYTPSAQALRRQPRILELADELGIADLWRETGRTPDFCADVREYYDCEAILAQQ